MENIILASTNLVAIVPVLEFYHQGCILQSTAVALAALASILYHLVECHKHGMPGVGVFTSARDHMILINIDRACAVFAVLACWDISALMQNYAIVLVALVGLTLSEQGSRYFNGPYRWLENNRFSNINTSSNPAQWKVKEKPFSLFGF